MWRALLTPSALMQTLWPALPPVSSSPWRTSTLTTVLSKSSSTLAVGSSVTSHPISASSAPRCQTFAPPRGILASSFFRWGGGGRTLLTTSFARWFTGPQASVFRKRSAGRRRRWCVGVCAAGCFEIPPRLNSHPKLYVWGQLSPRGRNEPWPHWSNKPLMKVLFINRPAAGAGQMSLGSGLRCPFSGDIILGARGTRVRQSSVSMSVCVCVFSEGFERKIKTNRQNKENSFYQMYIYHHWPLSQQQKTTIRPSKWMNEFSERLRE